MKNQFSELIDYIPKIENGVSGKWIFDNENDGTPEHPKRMPYVKYSESIEDFVESLYHYCDEHPEFDHKSYGETLKSLNLEWTSTSMQNADVSEMDAKSVIALLIGAVRADRFCEGALFGFFKNGCILRWLSRLEEIGEEKQ